MSKLRHVGQLLMMCVGLALGVATPGRAAEPGVVDAPDSLVRLKQSLSTLEHHVVGRPNPPLPYVVEPIYPKLKLDNPMIVLRQPGTTRLFLIDQGGKRLVRTGTDPSDGELEVLFTCSGIQYSICTHPDFLKNGLVYLGGDRASKTPSGKECTVIELRLDPKRDFEIVKSHERLILAWDSNGHNGAAIGFGHDRMLYITTGDGTSDSDTNVTGQKMDVLLAKVLRIDIEHPAEGKTYSVPKDNPFVGRKGIRPETWAFGLRNPWRLSVDPLTGDIWVGNNGQDLWEQIYRVQRGDNYGWSVYEGSHPFYLERKLGPAPHVKPTFEHPHSEARSMTGGVVSTARSRPDLYGAYVYGDHSTGKIWAGKMEDDKVAWHKEIADSTLQIVGFGEDGAGNMLVVDYRKPTTLYALKARKPPENTPRPFPRKLSETGLFQSVRGHAVHPALIPYDVVSPLWSDGAIKRRFIALPTRAPVKDEPKGKRTIGSINTGDQTRGWGFENGTVLVKSFGYDLAGSGRPGETEWIETRLLHREQGEWVGYSYRWNREQTEAVLVDGGGADAEYQVLDTKGKSRKQAWRFPSRAECMVCHSRAAKYVLGLTTVQFNRAHGSDPGAPNQLSMLDYLGVAKLDHAAEWKARRRRQLENNGALEAEIKKDLAAYTVPTRKDGAVFSGPLISKPALVNPYRQGPSLELRVRSYLHANCAQCHVGAGGGNAQMELNFSTKMSGAKVVGAKPVHTTFGIAGAKLVAPGEPEKSILLKRLQLRGRGQMPQLATTRSDSAAVALFRNWIASLRPAASSGE